MRGITALPRQRTQQRRTRFGLRLEQAPLLGQNVGQLRVNFVDVRRGNTASDRGLKRQAFAGESLGFDVSAACRRKELLPGVQVDLSAHEPLAAIVPIERLEVCRPGRRDGRFRGCEIANPRETRRQERVVGDDVTFTASRDGLDGSPTVLERLEPVPGAHLARAKRPEHLGLIGIGARGHKTQRFLEIRDLRTGAAEIASGEPAAKVKPAKRLGIVGVGRPCVGAGAQLVRRHDISALLMVEDGRDVFDRARGRDEGVVLERRRHLPGVLDGHRRLTAREKQRDSEETEPARARSHHADFS